MKFVQDTITGYKDILPQGVEKIVPLDKFKFPNIRGNYWVSTYGNVFTTDQFGRLKQMKLQVKPNNYVIVTLATYDDVGYAVFHVHRLLMIAFNYRPDHESLDVNHKDSIRTHNWIWNLEWMTRRDNIRYALNNGKMGYGENATGSIHDNATITKCCDMLEAGVNKGIIAKELNLPYNTVYQIFRGNTWLIISKDYTFLTQHYAKFFNEYQLGKIFDLINMYPEMTPHSILMELGIDAVNLDKPYDRILPNLVNKMRYDLGLPLVI